MANPKPILPPVWDIIAVLIPITSPLILNKGPPEFPLLIDASVCINSVSYTHPTLPTNREV